jgi:hypothetical protein
VSRCLADGVASVHPAEHRSAMDVGGVEPYPQRVDRAPTVSDARVRHRDHGSCALLIGLRRADRDLQSARGVEREILDVERDELRAPEGGSEPEQQQSAVTPSSVRFGLDPREHPLERLELERLGSAELGDTVLPADPGHHRRDRCGVAWRSAAQDRPHGRWRVGVSEDVGR